MPVKPTSWTPNRYPSARRSDHVDVYKSESKGEVRVHDPYEWLEHDTEETDKWTSAQVEFTREYLNQNLERQDLEDEIRKNTDYARFSAPSLKKDGKYYWYYNSGLQPQSVIYRTRKRSLPDIIDEQGPDVEIFFDPNLLSDDGTAALAATAFSPCGDYFAYGIARSGSDFFTVYVRPTSAPFAGAESVNVTHDDGRLPDELRFVKFSSLAWTHDSKGFFYQRFPDRDSHGAATEDKAGTETQSDKNAMLFYHRIGTSQAEDILVHKDDSNPEWMWGAEITEIDGRYVMISITKDTSRKYLIWIADLEKDAIGQNMQWDKLIDQFDAKYEYIANDGTNFYFLTNKDAPKHKLVSVDIADAPDKRVFKNVIPEQEDATLERVTAINGDSLVVVYKRNVKDEIYLYSMTGKEITRIAPEFVGSISVGGRRDHSRFFAQLTDFTTPGSIALYDFAKPENDRWTIYRETEVAGLKPADFVSEQVWYDSKDGTKVPMFIVRHKDTKFDGTAAAWQYGYGGFSISINPFFSASLLTFAKKYGAILAVANIRGGSEFGEEWHLAGTKERKVNCFDDFIAAAQFLVDKKYAAPGKVILNGGSNGGLLVAACVNRAPEGLLGAAVAEVGVLDLLKFADFTIGRAWTSDYGNPHDAHDFDFIHPISPLHNIPTDKILPPTLLLTADHDDRVVPLHSFKHAATMQHLLPHNPHPLLIRIDKKAGHGAGKSTQKRIVEAADKLGFVAQALGLPVRGGQ
ncbi:hypothetical protein CERSUDRAFT_88707 [Gelatoporia subvermispora B]|uniref:Prolyl endopeptidase n=1 Tax=Ceriporiopsis subvermispora (strain B) TaxID=914234 RepID=M2Q4U8_CERS8|nr:hypothetical protein CERSUDRAFT_88707 [Gelatoporia subvermispora B]